MTYPFFFIAKIASKIAHKITKIGMRLLWQQKAERMVSFMKNIFVEGIQGAGKSTLVNGICEAGFR